MMKSFKQHVNQTNQINNEEYITTDQWGSRSIEIFKNPTHKELKSCRGEWGDGAGIVLKNDWYAFSGNYFHDKAEKSIQKIEKFSKKGAIYIRFMINNNGTVTSLGPDGAINLEQPGINTILKKEMNFLKTHRTLKNVISNSSDSFADYIDSIEHTNNVGKK